MLNELVVMHHHAGLGVRELPAPITGLYWRTCLREVLLLNRSECLTHLAPADANLETYRAENAYRFLLEVICGLHSPLVAETAVLGQFREFCVRAKFPATSWGWFLSQFTADLLEDAKRVRHRHLQGLGSQSYGSVVRQHLTDVQVTAVLGSGKLAKEILPWLIGKTEVRLFYRNPDSAEILLRDCPQIQLNHLRADDSVWNPEPTALVIAAPLTGNEIKAWIALQSARFTKALDLRGEAESDPLQTSFPIIKLPELFAAIAADQRKIAPRIAAARAEIDELTSRRSQQAQFRPFGWEDLCA